MMRALTLGLFWCFLLASCTEVSFPVAQPSGVAALQEIPPPLRGAYQVRDESSPEKDTLIVDADGYHFIDKDQKEFLNRGRLNDSLVIKQYQQYYFVNFRSNNQWILRLVKQHPGGHIELLSLDITDEARLKAMTKRLGLKIRKFQFDEDTYFQINPSAEQLVGLVKEGYFKGGELDKVR